MSRIGFDACYKEVRKVTENGRALYSDLGIANDLNAACASPKPKTPKP